MKNEQIIEFACITPDCGQPVRFTLELIEKENPTIQCRSCGREYPLPEEVVRKLGYLKDLIETIRRVRPILGKSSVGIEVAGHKVSIPYYLLLTRMTSELALQIDDEQLSFRFIVNPIYS